MIDSLSLQILSDSLSTVNYQLNHANDVILFQEAALWTGFISLFFMAFWLDKYDKRYYEWKEKYWSLRYSFNRLFEEKQELEKQVGELLRARHSLRMKVYELMRRK